MKWPWQDSERKSHIPLVALAQLPGAKWNRSDAASLIREGYAGNAVVHRCVRMIAEAAASVPLSASHENVASLLVDPNPDEAGRALLERLYSDLQITGNSWAEAIVLDDDIEPKAIYALQAGSVRVLRDKSGRLQGYAAKTAQGERHIGKEIDGWCSVLHLKLYNPTDAHMGLSPLYAGRKALGLHDGTISWAKALLDNAARPSGALVYGKDGARMTDEQFDRLKAELSRDHAGPSNAGRPLLLEGGLDWKPMSLSPAEMDFQETRNSAAREIALAFGVPPMLLGIPGDNTYATYKEAHRAFWRLTVLPLVERTAEALTVWLRGRFSDAVISPQLDQVPAFAEDRERLWARVSNADFLSAEEKKAVLGLSLPTVGADA